MIESKESLLRRCVLENTAIEMKAIEREAIAQQVEAFLAGGGEIKQVDSDARAEFDGGIIYRRYPDEAMSNDHGLPYAAEYLGVSQSTLKRMLRAGTGPAHQVQPVGRNVVYRFRMADLRAYREQREKERGNV